MQDDTSNKAQAAEVSIRKRRKLLHWSYDGSVYFITWRLHINQIELQPAERDLVAETLKHFDGQRYNLFGYVVMNDHVHLLVHPHPQYPLPQIVHSWKSYTANRLQRQFKRKGCIWQEEYFDRITRNEREFYDTASYILNNPRKRWNSAEYPWLWFKGPEV